LIALIAVSAAVYAIDKPYSYVIPDTISVQPGMRVIVPFGKGNRRSEGVVLEVLEGDSAGLKAIERSLDAEPVLSETFIRMAAFLRERYFCTFYEAIKAMLPAGLWFDSSEAYIQTDTPLPKEKLCSNPEAQSILNHILAVGGKASRAEIKTALAMDDETLQRGLQWLMKQKLLRSSMDFSRRVQDKTEQIALLSVPAEEAMEYAAKKQRSAPLQFEVLKLLCAIGSGSTKEICYLTGASMQTIRRLEKLGFLELHVRDVFRRVVPNCVQGAAPIVLNDEQDAAFHALLDQHSRDVPGVSLLYGVTGSGKTLVYIRLMQEVLRKERSAILLVPEIALTPQLVSLLMSHFGSEVAVLHSALRVSERYDEWKRIRQGKAHVVIGTRSAVFAPVHDLGLIIVDEEQEHTYKSENSPRYHAREVAVYRGNKEHALVVLGSATPSIETMYYSQMGIYGFTQLSSRYNGDQLPCVEIVDMKQEIRDGNPMSLSKPLQTGLTDTFSQGHQAILFLNRRGAGRCLICVDCGAVSHCPRCSVNLTYHRANHRLMCHYCGFSQPVPENCPECGGTLKILGSGTQKIEEEFQALFPDTSFVRMDADTISVSNNHEAILERFRKDEIPVLIGTQMVTKGLNFENVTLVGIVDADMSLYAENFRAAETTFSMLTQVIGRAGRGKYPGKALIQTMTPEHTVIQLAAKQDYMSFYDLEISVRQLHGCPPFQDLFSVMFVGIFEDTVIRAACDFRTALDQTFRRPEYNGLQIQMLGPSPASVAKINNAYRYRLMLRCKNTKNIRMLLSHWIKTFSKNKAYRGVAIFADINSYE